MKLKELKSLKKFGTKSPAESKIIKDKIIQTNNIKYGGNSPMYSEVIKEKSKNTLFKNHGVTCPSHDLKILNNRIKSFKESNFKENFKSTILDRYGVDTPWKSKHIHQKSMDKKHIDYTDKISKKIDDNKFKLVNSSKSNDNKTTLHFHGNCCNSEFKIKSDQFYYRINNNLNICTNCYPISKNTSIVEIEMYNFIKENTSELIIRNDRNIIKPYEIDVYLPNLKIAFEFNGTYWHSTKFKGKNYHLDKFNMCNLNNIKLITICESNWINNLEYCKLLILQNIKPYNNYYENILKKLINITNIKSITIYSNNINSNRALYIKLGFKLFENIEPTTNTIKIRNKKHEIYNAGFEVFKLIN